MVALSKDDIQQLIKSMFHLGKKSTLSLEILSIPYPVFKMAG